MIYTGSPAGIAVVIWQTKADSGASRCAPITNSRPCGSLQLSAAVIAGPDAGRIHPIAKPRAADRRERASGRT